MDIDNTPTENRKGTPLGTEKSSISIDNAPIDIQNSPLDIENTIKSKANQHAYLDDLNEAQREAVSYLDGPALVIAGAGSGKTRVLVYKLLHLLASGYAPYRLMALTFTNKAAREMRSRIEQVAGRQARYIMMGTFHAIFLRILRQHAPLLGYTSSFTVYNTNDSKNKVKAIIKLMELDDKIYKPGTIFARISNAKNRLISPEQYRANSDIQSYDAKAHVPRCGEIYAKYMHELRQSNAMDFDDLLMQINILFRDHPEVLKEWQERIDYLLIDEYQDTNFAQYMIARQLMQNKGAICVVGDDAQSIYSFRGANIENILGFQKAFPETRVFKLEENYRSSQTIVRAASELITHNRRQLPKEVFSRREVGEPIEVHEAFTGDLEAMWVCKSIMNLREKHGANYEDFAVLYRTNAQSRSLEQAFRRFGMPFRIWGGRSFFDHREIQDILAYLRLMVNELDDEAMLRIINYPKRGIGDTTILKLRQASMRTGVAFAHIVADPELYDTGLSKGTITKLRSFSTMLEEMRARCAVEQNFYELVQWLINYSGIPTDLATDLSLEGKTRQENVREMLTSIEEYVQNSQEEGQETSLSAYLSEVALITDQDSNQEDTQPKVTFMTIHASKGLEFPHIFIIGLEEQLFPSAMSSEGKDLEEERRLMYVAITRAEKTCHIGYARERFRNGKTELVRPSRFLRELPQDLIKRGQDVLSADMFHQTSKYPSRYASRGDNLPSDFSSNRSFLPEEPCRTNHPTNSQVRSFEPVVPSTQHQSIGALRVGGRVLHMRFGEGELLSLEGKDDEAMAYVKFDTGETKKLLLRYAKLEPID